MSESGWTRESVEAVLHEHEVPLHPLGDPEHPLPIWELFGGRYLLALYFGLLTWTDLRHGKSKRPETKIDLKELICTAYQD